MAPKLNENGKADSLEDAVIQRVLRKIDADGLLDEVIEQLAARLVKDIRIEALVEQLATQRSKELASRLAESLLKLIK